MIQIPKWASPSLPLSDVILDKELAFTLRICEARIMVPTFQNHKGGDDNHLVQGFEPAKLLWMTAVATVNVCNSEGLVTRIVNLKTWIKYKAGAISSVE